MITFGRMVRTFAKDRWWRSFPFLPLPTWQYVKFRQDTMYGRHGVRVLPRMAWDFPQFYRWWKHMDGLYRLG